MQKRRLGNSNLEVSALALGCMGMSGMYGPADERESIATIHAALDAGVTLLDTGDYYGAGHNELLIGRALRDRRGQGAPVGEVRRAARPRRRLARHRRRPAAVKNFLAYTLTRLGVDHDRHLPAGRLDPAVPIEDTIGAIADLVQGRLRPARSACPRWAPDTIRRAHGRAPDRRSADRVLAHQPRPGGEDLPALAELGIGVTAYGVLSRGLLSGSKPGDPGLPRAPAALHRGKRERNQELVDRSPRNRRRAGCTATQLAIAWVLAKGQVSCRSSARARAPSSTNRSARSTYGSRPTTSRASKRPSPPPRSRARATTSTRCASSTASVHRERGHAGLGRREPPDRPDHSTLSRYPTPGSVRR